MVVVTRFANSLNYSRGTANGGLLTQVGDDCLIMQQAHIAHDCVIGNDVIMANDCYPCRHVVSKTRQCRRVFGVSSVLPRRTRGLIGGIRW